jgi:DNA invertase Pin-like site-specific DNA recombinase
MQLRELNEYAEQRGYIVLPEHEFVDQGVSGSKSDRPALNRLMKAAKKREFKMVLVWRFDRFARSTKHLVNALAEFKQLNIAFISLNENIDTSSSIGEAIFTIIAAMAQLERDIIRERVNAGLRNARAKGKVLGQPRKVKAEEILNRLSSGMSKRQIAKELKISRGSVEWAAKRQNSSQESVAEENEMV